MLMEMMTIMIKMTATVDSVIAVKTITITLGDQSIQSTAASQQLQRVIIIMKDTISGSSYQNEILYFKIRIS